MSTATPSMAEDTTRGKELGYQSFQAGKFHFERDEYFAHIGFPGGRHIIGVDAFLRSLMRDVGWGFFYGTVNFDHLLGTINHYGTVDLFLGTLNEAYRASNRDYMETFDSKELKKI